MIEAQRRRGVRRRHNRWGCFALVALASLASCVVYVAAQEEDAALGEQLVRQFWEAIRTEDVKTLEAILAPGFQSTHEDGTRDREAELALCADIDIDEYELTDFMTTRQGATIIVTFLASVEETLEGFRTTTTPAPRMAVFLMTEVGWQLIAYANLNPMADG